MKVKDVIAKLQEFDGEEELCVVKKHMEQGSIVVGAVIKISKHPVKYVTDDFIDAFDGGRYSATVLKTCREAETSTFKNVISVIGSR